MCDSKETAQMPDERKTLRAIAAWNAGHRTCMPAGTRTRLQRLGLIKWDQDQVGWRVRAWP